jgi:hypothetical protein
MQGSEDEAKIDGAAGKDGESGARKAGAGAAAQPVRGAPQFRLPPRTMALTLLALVALVGGGWFLFGKLRAPQAPDAERESVAVTRTGPENAASADSPENLDQLTAARAAHEAIMASETAPLVGAGLFSAPVSVTPTPGAGPESTAPAPSPAATPPAAPPAPPPAAAAPAPAKNPAAQRPAIRPLAPSPEPPDADKPTPSVANDPQALGPGGCTLGDGRSLGQSLGRCLEEYNEIDRELRRTGRIVRRHHG